MALKLRTLVPSAARTTSGSANVNLPNDGQALIAQLEVTAHAGTTPTLDVKFQDSVDGTNYIDIPSAAFTQVTTTDGRTRLAITAPFTGLLKVVWTIGGTTPSYTFSVKARLVGE